MTQRPERSLDDGLVTSSDDRERQAYRSPAALSRLVVEPETAEHLRMLPAPLREAFGG